MSGGEAWAPGSTTSGAIPVPSSTTNGKRSRKQLLTESRQKAFRRCMREHSFRYLSSIVPATEREALRFGSLTHYGLDPWWWVQGKADRDALAEALQGVEDALTPESDPYEIVRVEELLRGYDARWGGEEYETIAVEAEFRTPLVNPETGAESRTWVRAGKIDVIVRDGAGRVLIVEHKTSSEEIGPGSNYWARLRLDGQVSGYFRGAESLGHQVEACLYDVIGKIGLRPYKATPPELRKYTQPKIDKKTGDILEPSRLYASQRETDETPEEYRLRVRDEIAAHPELYYQRGEVVRLEEEMRAHDLETWQQAGVMRDAERLGIAPRNPDACVRFGSVCSYFDVCAGVDRIENEQRFKRLEWPHPELTQG